MHQQPGAAAINRLWEKIREKSGLGKREFNKAYKEPAEEWFEREYAGPVREREARRKALEAGEDPEKEKRLELPEELTVEQHLFNLTFKEESKPIKVINHTFRQYDPDYGYWKSVPDELIERRVLETSEEAFYRHGKDGSKKKSLATVPNIERTMKFAAKKLFQPSESTNNSHLIAFKNGTVCTKTGMISEHSPENHITSGLPYEYEPDQSECPPAMQRYINSSFGADQVEYVRAAIALVLDLTAEDKFIHVIGPSGSGKGVFTRLMMKFFGSELVGSPNNFRLFAEPEKIHQYLGGKRFVAVDDIVGHIGEEIGRFYTAVERTGMDARSLFQPRGYTQQFDIRYLVASCAQLPAKYSNSKGWERRVFPLPTLSKQEPDRDLEVELEAEVGAIISWALSMDKAERNKIIANPGKYNQLAADYFVDSARTSSSAWAFIEECLQPSSVDASDTIEGQTTDIGIIYNAYKVYCAEVGKRPMSLDGFKGEVKQALPLNFVPRKGPRGCIPRRFVYIELIPGLFKKNESDIVGCNLGLLGEDGVKKFKDWGKENAHLWPYLPQNLQQAEPKPVATTETAPPQPQQELIGPEFECLPEPESELEPEPAGLPPIELEIELESDLQDDAELAEDPIEWTSEDPPGITPYKPKWHGFELDLIRAETFEQLQATKAEYGEAFRREVMAQWIKDGRFTWLQAKAERLKEEQKRNAIFDHAPEGTS